MFKILEHLLLSCMFFIGVHLTHLITVKHLILEVSNFD